MGLQYLRLILGPEFLQHPGYQRVLPPSILSLPALPLQGRIAAIASGLFQGDPHGNGEWAAPLSHRQGVGCSGSLSYQRV